MDCSCGGVCKKLYRVSNSKHTRWEIDQCIACGREYRLETAFEQRYYGDSRGARPDMKRDW